MTWIPHIVRTVASIPESLCWYHRDKRQEATAFDRSQRSLPPSSAGGGGWQPQSRSGTEATWRLSVKSDVGDLSSVKKHLRKAERHPPMVKAPTLAASLHLS